MYKDAPIIQEKIANENSSFFSEYYLDIDILKCLINIKGAYMICSPYVLGYICSDRNCSNSCHITVS